MDASYRIENAKNRGTFFSGWMGVTPLWGDSEIYKPYLTFFEAEMDVARLTEQGCKVSIRSVVKSPVTVG